MATRILAVLNQKGGVGKTTTCVNLGAALARRGFRVLLVDVDPQANLTVHLGLEPSQLQRTSYSLLLGQHGLAEAVHDTGVPNLFVVPSTLALANAEIQLAATVGRELVLRESLEAWLEESAPDSDGPAADFVLIDCPPSLGTLTMNALCAAGEVLLPIQTEFFALQGVAGILESIRAVQRLNRDLRLSLVVPSLVDKRTTLARDVIEEVRAYFGDAVTETVIRKNVKLAEAPSHGKTIFDWDPRCNGAEDYANLAREVLGENLPDESTPERAATPEEAVTPERTPEGTAEGTAEGTPEEDAGPERAALIPEATSTPEATPEATPDESPEEGSSTESSEPSAAEPAAAEPTQDGAGDEPPVVAPLDDEPAAPETHARSSGIGLPAEYAAATEPEPAESSVAETEEPAAPEPPSRLPVDASEDATAPIDVAISRGVVPELPATSDSPAASGSEAAPERTETENPSRLPPTDEQRRASWWSSLRKNALGR